MSTFGDREKAFEDRFAHDNALRFKAEAKRNKLLGQWAGEKLGHSGSDLSDYVVSVVEADLEEPGHEDVVRKVSGDFAAANVAVSDDEIRMQLEYFFNEAKRELAE